MPVYIVTGKLGGGKTLCMVGKMQDYLLDGRPVATNVQLDLQQLTPNLKKPLLTRLPDRPTVADLEALGQVDTGADESKNGALVLDECGTWLNSRTWSDKGRQAVIDWMLHSRKYGWDVYLIIQNISLLDKQIRDSIAEYVVHCRRLDRMNIPVIGRVIRLLTLGLVDGRLPHVHLAVVSYGVGMGAVQADTWWYRGRDLYAAYSTRQVIAEGADASGAYSVLPPTWYDGQAKAHQVRELKPKRPEVAALMALPPEQRWAAARRLAA